MSNQDIHTLSSEERDFLEKLLAKQRLALTYAIKRHLGDMYADLYDECLSDIYWVTMQKVGEMMTLTCPEKWLMVVARIISFNVRSRRNKQLSYVDFELIENIPCTEDIFEVVLHNIWLEQDAYTILKKELTKRELEVFGLMFEQRISCHDIAAQLGISESTVWNIRKNIKDKYKYAIKNKL